MNRILALGTVSLLAAALSACNKPPAANSAALVGAWSCVTKSGGAIPDLNDTQTFTADGWYSSSSFPEGKKYQYRVEGDKLVISLASGDWSAKINRLGEDSLEYFNDATGQTKVACQKKK